VLQEGWQVETLLRDLIALDYGTVAGLNERNEGNVQQWSSVFQAHPWAWRILVTKPEMEIVGYWNFVFLADEVWRRAVQGKMFDSEIGVDRIVPPVTRGFYRAYFTMITTRGRHLIRIAAIRALWDSLFRVIHELAVEGIFLGEICTSAATPEGKRVCTQRFKMKWVAHNPEHWQVYHVRITQRSARQIFQSYPAILDLYLRAIDERTRARARLR
jgi:hypothetical protein